MVWVCLERGFCAKSWIGANRHSVNRSKPRADVLRSTNVWQSKVYSRSFVRNSSEHSRSHVLQKIQDTSSIMHVTKLRGSGRPAMNSRSSLACERLGHQHSAFSLTTRIDSCFLLNNIISHLRVGIVTRRNGRHIFVEVLIRVKGLERSPWAGDRNLLPPQLLFCQIPSLPSRTSTTSTNIVDLESRYIFMKS